MSAVVIGLLSYLMLTAMLAVIIVVGLSLLAWVLGVLPSRRPGLRVLDTQQSAQMQHGLAEPVR